MKGELGCKVNYIEINSCNELQIVDDKGEFLFLVGDNDWIELLKNARIHPHAKYYNMLVEIRYKNLEFKHNGRFTGCYPRGFIKSINEYGECVVETLHDGKRHNINVSWLFDIKNNKQLNMDGFTEKINWNIPF